MNDDILRREEANGIHRLVMNDGPNALRPELMETLSDALAELAGRGAPPILIGSGHEVLFCPGWDLKLIAGADRTEVGSFLALFNRLVLDLFSYPGPTAAAVNGHAVAGGCLLAMCCDRRIMATGRPRIGLSELNLGVPVPAASLVMLSARLAPDVVEEMVMAGDGLTAERARDLGVVQRIAEPTETMATAERELARIASKPADAYSASKRFLHRDSWQRMAAPAPADDAAFLDSWFSDDAQMRIAGIVERLGR